MDKKFIKKSVTGRIVQYHSDMANWISEDSLEKCKLGGERRWRIKSKKLLLAKLSDEEATLPIRGELKGSTKAIFCW